MPTLSSETLHATTVAIGGQGVVIEGRSGSGKSDLALRLIDRGAILVADDQTILRRENAVLVASPPATIAGRIEVRGLGIVPMAHVAEVPVALVVRLENEPQRLPEPAARRIAGVAVRELALDGAAQSAAIKIELALKHPDQPPQ